MIHNGVNTEFIDSMESYKYPIFATMYHPEYQSLDFVGAGKWNIGDNEETDTIGYTLSSLMYDYGRLNNNRVKPGYNKLITVKMAVDRVDSIPYPMAGDDLAVNAKMYKSEPKIE